jgi:hypothetical protein
MFGLLKCMKQKPLKCLCSDALVFSQGSVVILTRQNLVSASTCTDSRLNKDVFKAAAFHTSPEGAHASTTEIKDAQPDDGILEFLLPLPDNVECISTQSLVASHFGIIPLVLIKFITY